MNTLAQKVTYIRYYLTEAGANPSMRETKRMIKDVTGYGEEVFISHPETLLTPEQDKALDEVIARRAKGEPLTRILGVREFWGLEFEVTPDTLDPRPDTETLIEAVLKSVTDKNVGARILDLGTGTGCISIALLSELPNASAVAVDISHEAALVAQRNTEKHKMSNRFTVIQGSWMEALKAQSFDIITSNPPYIPESDIDDLDIAVKNHDPIIALSGGKSGLECYKKVISELKIHLNHKNKAFLEIGVGQLESVTGLVEESGLFLCDSYADIAGIPRVVEISNGDK